MLWICDRELLARQARRAPELGNMVRAHTVHMVRIAAAFLGVAAGLHALIIAGF
ncbi:hypothetical protein [Pseudodesulfovibrio senegalensis]|uniref:hypothetical protein n=1 Tax=Pseudodesulfovibrio senegalensis TaxID=1721087 RepID=UPI001375896E|nr:hypothetical protein [Pseudodesulfovibrio senegalensis]